MLDSRLLFVSIVWGMNFAIVKFAMADLAPLAFTIVRFLAASLFLFLVMKLRKTPFAVRREDRAAVIRLGFIGITVYNIFFMLGLHRTTASHSALLISLSPLVAALIQAATGRERMTVPAAAGLLIAAAGVVLIIRSHGGLGFSSSLVLGDLLTLCGAVAWALYTVAARPLLLRYPPMAVTAWSMAAGSLLLLPVALPSLVEQPWARVQAASWAALAFSALISAGIAFTFWYDGVKRIGVTRTAVYHYLMPFVAVLFAAVFLAERVTPSQVAGGLAVLGGVALVQRAGRQNRENA